MTLVDTHCHLDQEEFNADRDAAVERAAQAGVETLLAVGTTALSSEIVVKLAATHRAVFAAVGIQPNYAAQAEPGDWGRIVTLVNKPKVVALGETGLDRHWDYSPFDVQQDYFDRHLRLSQDRGIPFVVHTRDSDADVLKMLCEAHRRGPLRGVMHSFSGTAETAAECLELGLYISFAGMVTYKKSDALREVAAKIPDNRILVETDSPYLAPHPLRGKRNEPANIVHTAARLAELRGQSLTEFAQQTTLNARALFRFSTIES